MRELLKRLRMERDMTQQDMADQLKISRSAYTNIELGRKDPSFKVAIRIKELLDYKYDDIFIDE